MIAQVDIYIGIGMNWYYDASITNFLHGSVGPLHICIQIVLHWFGFIINFYIMFPNHKPLLNYNIINYLEYSVNIVTLLQLGVLIVFEYSGSKEDTVLSFDVNDIG